MVIKGIWIKLIHGIFQLICHFELLIKIILCRVLWKFKKVTCPRKVSRSLLTMLFSPEKWLYFRKLGFCGKKNNCTKCSLNSIVQVCLTRFSLFKSDNIVQFLFSIEIQDGTFFFEKQELNSGLKKITCFKKRHISKEHCSRKVNSNFVVKKRVFFTFAVIILFPLPCLSDSSLAQNHSLMFSEVSPSVSFKVLSINCSLTNWNFVFLCNLCDLSNMCSWCIYLQK